MKYIKLFEQFEEEESWWDEPDPYVDRLVICYYDNETRTDYYLGTVDGDVVLLFEDHPIRSYSMKNGWKVSSKTEMFADSKIIIFDPKNKYNKGFFRNNNPWKTFEFENLPREIKDRLI